MLNIIQGIWYLSTIVIIMIFSKQLRLAGKSIVNTMEKKHKRWKKQTKGMQHMIWVQVVNVLCIMIIFFLVNIIAWVWVFAPWWIETKINAINFL